MQLIKNRVPTVLAAALATVAMGAATVVVPALTPSAAVAGHKKHKKKHHKKKKSKTTVVTVNDDYFYKPKVTIHKGGSIKWVWSQNNFNTHNVYLDKGPKKLKKKKSFDSGSAVSGATFKKRFTTPGTYHFECQFHAGMVLTIKVKK